MTEIFLHNILREGNPPVWGFRHFVVGSLSKQSPRIIGEIEDIDQYGSASKTFLILGRNGNGKTLLSQLILEKITKLNDLSVRENLKSQPLQPNEIQRRVQEIINNDNGDQQINDIRYLCSTISVKQVETDLGVTRLIAQSLSRSVYEEPAQTFRAIILRITKKILDNYQPNFLEKFLRFGIVAGKVLISNIIQIKDDELKEISEIIATGSDEAQTGLNELKRIIDKKTTKFFQNQAVRDKLAALSADFYFNDYLEQFVFGQASIYDDKNITGQKIFDSFKKEMRLKNLSARDELKAVHELAQHAGCKVLVIILDECSPEKDPTSWLTNIIDTVATFENPKVLMLIMGVNEVWNRYDLSNQPDQSLFSRLYIDALDIPIKIQEPTEEDIRELWTKLKYLIVTEITQVNKTLSEVNIPDNYFDQFQGKTYRYITRIMIDKILQYVKDL